MGPKICSRYLFRLLFRQVKIFLMHRLNDGVCKMPACTIFYLSCVIMPSPRSSFFYCTCIHSLPQPYTIMKDTTRNLEARNIEPFRFTSSQGLEQVELSERESEVQIASLLRLATTFSLFEPQQDVSSKI